LTDDGKHDAGPAECFGIHGAAASLKETEVRVECGIRKQAAAKMHETPEARIAEQPCRPKRLLTDAARNDVPARGVEFVQARGKF
jgi:hypothetical protein